MSSTVELTGGAFQDSEGNPLANGYLLFELSQDAVANATDQICAGFKLMIKLDSSGNVITSPAQNVWPNDVLTPFGTFYMVSGYAASGELVWGPNAQQVLTPSPFDIGAWVPGTVNTLNGPVPTYDVGVFLQGMYTASQLVVLLKLERQVRFSTNFGPSTATIATNPTSTITFTINQNGAQVGTLSINTSGVATFSTSGAVLFNAGDILSIIAPTATDPTAANVGIILSGTVTGS